MKYEDCRIEGIDTRPDGSVMVTVRLPDGAVSTLLCTCRRFLRWVERTKSDVRVRELQRWRVDLWIESGVIVEVEALRRGNDLTKLRHMGAGGDSGGNGGPPDDSRCTGVGRGQREELQLLLDTESAWIRSGERQKLNRYIQGLGTGRPLTSAQETWLEELRYRIENRKDPKFFRG